MTKHNNITEKGNSSKKYKKSILLLIFGIVLCFVLRILFYLGKTDFGFRTASFEFIPTYTIFTYIFVAILWRRFNIIRYRDNMKFIQLLIESLLSVLPIVITGVITGILNPVFYDNKSEYLEKIWSALFIAAFLEELFFRGFIYELFKKILRVFHARLITSLIFSFWHINLIVALFSRANWFLVINLITIFVLGLITCELYDRTNSLMVPILYHAINNGVIYHLVSCIVT